MLALCSIRPPKDIRRVGFIIIELQEPKMQDKVEIFSGLILFWGICFDLRSLTSFHGWTLAPLANLQIMWHCGFGI